MARIGSRVKRIHPKAVEMLKEQSWPGNVRQLHHEIQRAMIFEESPELKVSSFGQSPEDPEVSSVQPALDAQASSTIRQAVGNVEDAMIRETLERNKRSEEHTSELQ